LHRFCFELLVLRKAAINLLAIADANDQDSQNIVVNLIEDAEAAGDNAVEVVGALKFLTAGGPWVFG
jgi:hypothetical protein